MKERPIRVPLEKIKPVFDKDGRIPGLDTSGKREIFVDGKIPGVDTSGVANIMRFAK